MKSVENEINKSVVYELESKKVGRKPELEPLIKPEKKMVIEDKVEIKGSQELCNIVETYKKPMIIEEKSEYERIEKIEKNIQEIGKLIELGKGSITEEHKQTVFVLGKTGVGKSTLVNYLAKAHLLGVDIHGEISVVCKENGVVEIGYDTQSTTSLPQKWIDGKGGEKEVVFWDCPGFEDNRGAVQDIVNSTYITNIVGRTKSLKLMLLMANSGTKGRANELIDFVQQLDKLFNGKALGYADSFLLVITKTPQGDSTNNIQQRLLKMAQAANIQESQRALVEKLVKNMAIFNEPIVDQELGGSNRELMFNFLDKLPYISEGVAINTTPSDKSITEVVDWYVDLTNHINDLFKQISKDSITQLEHRVNEGADLEQIIDKIEALNDIKYEDVIRSDFKKFTTYFQRYVDEVEHILSLLTMKSEQEMLKKLPHGVNILNEEGNMPQESRLFDCREIFTKLSSVEYLESFVPVNITLSYRADLLNAIKHHLVDLKFVTKLQVKGTQHENELREEARYAHYEVDGIYANVVEPIIVQMREHPVRMGGIVGGTAAFITGGIIGGGTVATIVGTTGLLGGIVSGAVFGPVGVVVGGLIGYSVDKIVQYVRGQQFNNREPQL